MTKKKLLNTALVSMLAVTGLMTSCNSAHELMEPAVVRTAGRQPKFMDNVALEGSQKTGVLTASVSGGTNRKPVDDHNFIISLNKFLNLKYANMLGVLPQVITNDLLYGFIDEWYGTRYRMGGMDKKGIDCSAFVQRLYERVFNVNILRTAAEQFSFCNSVFNKNDLKEGDLVFFHIKTKRISHVGIYLMNDYFVHSSSSNGVMISNLNDKYWQKYFAGAGRVPKNSKLKIDPGTL
jgi:murein DD-endopeptidase / murein LD-carboxypeptidase